MSFCFLSFEIFNNKKLNINFKDKKRPIRKITRKLEREEEEREQARERITDLLQ